MRPSVPYLQLDGDGKRRISGRQTEKPCEDHRRDGWENCGLWTEGFPEYGGVYGAGSGRYHFNKSEGLRKKSTSYDRIITGDLGYIGQSILLDFMSKNGHQMRDRHLDCGMKIFDQEKQDTHAGGSGCGCAAVTLSAYILPKIQRGEWKRVLFVPTGALMSTVSYNEGASVPGIAHGIVLEHC